MPGTLMVWILGALLVLSLAGAGWVWIGPWIARGAFPSWRVTPYIQADLQAMKSSHGVDLSSPIVSGGQLARFLT